MRNVNIQFLLCLLITMCGWVGATQAANVSVFKSGSGTITSNPGKTETIDCGNKCLAVDFNDSTTVTLSAIASPGYTFARWTNGTGDAVTCNNTLATQCQFTSTTNTTVEAIFAVNTTTNLTVIKEGSSSDFGTVTSQPVGIDCNTGASDCSENISAGTNITLTATSAPGASFAGWEVYFNLSSSGTTFTRQTNMCTGLEPTCNITMAYETQVRAKFNSDFILTTVREGTGSGSVISSPANLQNVCTGNLCNETFKQNQVVTLTASANSGSQFVGWSGEGTDDGDPDTICTLTASTCSVKMDKAHSITAIFATATGNNASNITLIKEGSGSNFGRVTSTPAGLDCGSSCSKSITNGTSVTLTATSSSSGAYFAGWEVYFLDLGKFVRQTNMCTGLEPTCNITMAYGTEVRAKFNSDSDSNLILTTVREGTGSGSVISSPANLQSVCTGNLCNETFKKNQVVTLVASANSGSQFIGWSGEGSDDGDPSTICTLTASTCSVKMDKAHLITATFAAATGNNASNLTLIKEGSGSDFGRVTSTPTGLDCGGTNQGSTTACSKSITNGTSVTLNATSSSAGAFFAGWEVYFLDQGKFVRQTNMCTGLEPTCNITMAYETQVRAKFDLGYILNLRRQGEGVGSILSTSNNLQQECTETSCTQTYNNGRSVTLTAIPTVNSSFTGWIVDGNNTTCPATSKNCTVLMDKAHLVTATFDKKLSGTYTVQLQKEGSGSGFGIVRSNPTGINCGTAANDKSCSATFNSNAGITFTASTDGSKGVFFSRWQIFYKRLNPDGVSFSWVQEPDMCTGNQPTCDVTMSADVKVTARFDFDFILTVVRDGNGAGKISSSLPELDKCTVDSNKTICSTTLIGDQQVKLTAIPEQKSRFVKWLGCDSMQDDNTDGAQEVCIVKMSQAQLVTATFEAIDSAKLSVTKDSNGTGSGTVKSDLLGLNCGAICNRNYPFNSNVVLTAIADAGSQFAGWGGDWCTGQEPTCTVTMSQAKDVSARFDKGHKLTLITQGSGQGSVTSNPPGINCGTGCASSYPESTKVVLTAQTLDGSTFQGWGGACSGTSLSCEVTMAASREVTVSFSGVSLGKALDNTILNWTTAGDVPWVGQLQKFYFGNSAAVSGVIKHGQESTIQTTVTGPGKLSFYWQVSSELNDTFTFEGAGSSSIISGTVNWTQKSVDIPAGTHVLKWTYAKDSDITQGSDSAWLDRVEYTRGNLLTVIKQGTGFGTVSSIPNGISCGDACRITLLGDSSIKLTANTIGNSEFTGWSGDGVCSGKSATCVVAGNAAHTVVATFNLNTAKVSTVALNLGLLNDTGIDACATNSALYSSDKENQCTNLSNSFPNQDAHDGRDAAARKGQLAKTGDGDAGFDYTKVCNSGSFAGEGTCPSAPKLGTGANEWGCTLDNVTGLIWELKTGAPLHDKDKTYTWHVADDLINGGSKGDVCVTPECNTSSFMKSVNAQSMCGANDWRLPSRRELHSIVHHGHSNPAIDLSYFPNTVAKPYWTATASASTPVNAWYVSFEMGWDFWDNKNKPQAARLVRPCDRCTKVASPVFRDNRLILPRIRVDNDYYQANLQLVHSNPLTFQLVNAERAEIMAGRSNNKEQSRYYADGSLEVLGVDVATQKYNAMLQQVPGSNPLRFTLQDAHPAQ